MNYGFNHEQLDTDLKAISDFFIKFIKSFGPSQKKIQDKPIGFFEELYIRFRLHIVEMGITKTIRSSIVMIVGIILLVTIFQDLDNNFKILAVFGFFLFYVWMFLPHLEEDKKTSLFAKKSIDLHKFVWRIQEEKKK
jgi:hypothetical protein